MNGAAKEPDESSFCKGVLIATPLAVYSLVFQLTFMAVNGTLYAVLVALAVAMLRLYRTQEERRRRLRKGRRQRLSTRLQALGEESGPLSARTFRYALAFH